MATYRGHASVAIPARGNGLLALTDRDLRLMRLVPRREFVVPLAQITKIEQVRAWKGSYKAGRPVIVVYYHEPAPAPPRTTRSAFPCAIPKSGWTL